MKTELERFCDRQGEIACKRIDTVFLDLYREVEATAQMRVELYLDGKISEKALNESLRKLIDILDNIEVYGLAS